MITISVTDYAISVEHRFDKNPYISRIVGSEFSWFNKCGGENSGLDVMIHLRDEKGRIVNDITETVYLKTELVYSDESPTPYMPLMPLKERRSHKVSETPLYNPLRPEPILNPGQTAISFSFRIEEVSFRHPHQSGFKLKVSHLGPSRFMVHSGLMEETIVVLSKQNNDASQMKKRGRCRAVAEKSILNENANISVQLPTFLKCFMDELDQCKGCKKKIPAQQFSFKSSHDSSCVLRTKLSPFLNLLSRSNQPECEQEPLAKTANSAKLSQKVENRIRSVTYHPEVKPYNATEENITNTKSFPQENKNARDVKSDKEKTDFNSIAFLDFDDQDADIDPANNPFYEWMGNFI